MSVPKGKRQEGKLQVINLIGQLADYTLEILRNEQFFPKRSRWQLPHHIDKCCIGALINIRNANAIMVVDRKTYRDRREHQYEAHKQIDALLALIDQAYRTNRLPGNKVEYWTGLCVKTDTALKGWMRSDKERYKQYDVSDEDVIAELHRRIDEAVHKIEICMKLFCPDESSDTLTV